jgi:hypothetical protein
MNMTDADRFDGFTSPGLVKVSSAALRMAREFSDQLRQQMPDQDWVVGFDWADSRQMRFPRPGGAMQELGPGFDLAAFERRNVPDAVIQTIEGTTFAMKVPSRVWLNSAKRLIDVDPNNGSGLTLR